MTVNNADFKVKKGLKVEGGNIDFSNAQHSTIAVDAITAGTSNTVGKNLTISSGTGTGNQLGGKLIFKTGGDAGTSGSTATTAVQALTIQPDGSVHIGTNGLDATVTSTGSSINSTIIGDHSQAAGYFTTLDATGTIEARATGSAIRTAGKLCVNEPDVDSSTIPNRTQAAVYGKTVGIGGTMSDGSTAASGGLKDYVELLLQTDAPEGDLDGYVANYVGNAVVLDNVEHVATTGQGTIYSVGASGTGDSWGVGRAGGTGGGSFQIGYKNESWAKSHGGTGNVMMPAQSMFKIDTSGNATLNSNGAYFAFTGATSGAASREIRFKASSNAISTDNTGSQTYTLPTDFPDGNGYVLSSQTNGTLSWIASSSGADGMGAGFQLEDDDGTEVAITTSKEVKFIGAGITTNWTDTDSGADTDPYDMTFTLDVDDLDTSANFAAGDLIAFADSSTLGNDTVKGTVNTLATLFAGTGLSATSAVISVDAAQTQITSVGALTSLSTAADSTIDLNGGAITVDGTTLSIDSTDTTNLTMTANDAGDKTLTIDAANTGSGAADIKIGTTSGTAVTIGNAVSEVTIGDNLTVNGDLIVTGSVDTVSSTTIVVEDKNLDLGSVANPNDTTANGGGITLKGDTDKTILWDSTNSNWTSNQDFNIASGKKFRINNVAVFESSTELTSTVVTSGLTQVGVLANGSIASGFGTISTGSAITTTDTITGGVLVADNLQLDGNVLSSTNTNGDITLTPNGTGEVNIAAGNLNYAGTAVTASGAELNVLDGVTAGTVSASLALVVDANKDLATIRNLTSNGTVQAAAVSVDAVAVLDTSRGSAEDITGATVLASYASATYKTAKYIYQIKKDSAVDTDVGEILVTYEGTSNDVYILEYGMISTGASIGAWSVNYNSGTVELKFTPTANGDHTYTILNTLLI